METIRQQLVNLVLSELRKIKVANGSKTDIGKSVWEWRAIPFQTDELPALIFRDLDEPVANSETGGQRQKRLLHCQIVIAVSGETSVETLRKILADVERAIKTGRQTSWGGLAIETRPRISRLITEQESDRIAGGIVEFFIDYATLAFDSYAGL